MKGQVGKIIALDENNHQVDVQIIGIRQADGNINRGETYNAFINDNHQLEWTPPSNIVTDDNATRQVVFAIQSKPKERVLQSDIEFVTVKVKNRISPDAMANIELASEYFKQANNYYSEAIKAPSCITANVLTYLSMNQIGIGNFEEAYSKIERSSLNIPAKFSALIAIGTGIAKGINKNKREKFENIIKPWKEKNGEIVEMSKDLIQRIDHAQLSNYKLNYISDQQAIEILQKAKDYQTKVKEIKASIHNLNSTIFLVGRKSKRTLILGLCNFPITPLDDVAVTSMER